MGLKAVKEKELQMTCSFGLRQQGELCATETARETDWICEEMCFDPINLMSWLVPHCPSKEQAMLVAEMQLGHLCKNCCILSLSRTESDSFQAASGNAFLF